MCVCVSECVCLCECLCVCLCECVHSCVQNNSSVLKKASKKLKILIITFTSIHTNALGTLHILF